MERIAIRIQELEKKLAGDAGTASVQGFALGGQDDKYITGNVTYHYSEAEKEAMQKELELLRAQMAATAGQ